MTDKYTYIIESIGSKGDGLVHTDQGLQHISFALPQEIVKVDGAGQMEITQASRHRQKPICQYFGHCGGCRMQHADDGLIATWKTGLAIEQFKREGLHPEVKFEQAHASGRRRVNIHVRRQDGRISAGFMKAQSHSLVDIEACPLLTASLQNKAFTIARTLGDYLQAAFKPFDAQITQTQTGIDVDLRGLGKLDEKTRGQLSQSLSILNIARLSLHGELIAQRHAPSLTFGTATVTLPAGGFLQATSDAEKIMTDAACQALAGSLKIIDLFSGVGPFALRLANQATILAADLDGSAIASLQHAWRNTPGLKPIKTEKRDLFHMPYLAKELAVFDAAVIDPPRIGAQAQTYELAKSSLKKIFSVGCHLQSFVRDAAILTKAGWTMGPVTVLDQFRYSSHLELMALFTRKTK